MISYDRDAIPVSIVIFSGGRGTETITKSLSKYKNITMTLLVNGYDDGLSTGMVRRLIPSMLGPSDFRKNYSRFLSLTGDSSDKSLSELLELRLVLNSDESGIPGDLIAIANKKYNLLDSPDLSALLLNIKVSAANTIADAINEFLNYYKINKNHDFTFNDMSFGNLVLAGLFIKSANFNEALEKFTALSKIKHNLLNITDGQPLLLTAVTNDNVFIEDEAGIVNNFQNHKIKEIYLIKEEAVHSVKKSSQRESVLKSLRITPTINQHAEVALRKADIIIYGPGTQYSSLFPSYLTDGVLEAITANESAEKIFISNVSKDNDIKFESVNSLFNSFLHYITRYSTVDEGGCDRLVDGLFFQDSKMKNDKNALEIKLTEFPVKEEKIRVVDFSDEYGKHSGSKTLLTLLENIHPRLRSKIGNASHKISIIVPGFNEETTVATVLKKLSAYNADQFNIDVEIIFVDGGSSDKTFLIASNIPGVKSFQLPKGAFGRGVSLLHGLKHASGDLIVFFPSDNEYEVADIDAIISPLALGGYNIVVGSRSYGISDLNVPLKHIYGENFLNYYISKVGGVALSLGFLIFFGRYLSDPLSGIKGFNRKIFNSWRLKSKGFDLDTEIISRCMKSKELVLEVPIKNYNPRKYDQGKKITALDGLKCIFAIIKVKLTSC